MKLTQDLPCPYEGCNAMIPFDTQQLMMGVQFACPDCQGQIGLVPESQPFEGEKMEKFKAIKRPHIT